MTTGKEISRVITLLCYYLHQYHQPTMAASLSEPCETELHDMYNVNSKTYNTLHDPNLMSQMTTKLDAPFRANFHVFNGDMGAFQEFTNTCESYVLPSSQSTLQSSSAGGGRVTFLSSTNKCTHDFNMGIPACIPSSCGGHSDAQVASALTDNPTPLFEGNDCSNVFWATEHIRNQNVLPLEDFSNSCMGDLITVAGSALAGASNVTAISGVKASGEPCVAYYNGQEYSDGASIVNGEFIPISYEMVCDGKVNNAMNGFFCMPSSCESRQMVAAALNEITHAEDVNPYFAFLFFSWNWRANCKWVYRVPEEALVSDNTDSSQVNETVVNQSESSSSSSVRNQRDMSWVGLIGSIGVVFLTVLVYS
jgi:hypothetical protein